MLFLFLICFISFTVPCKIKKMFSFRSFDSIYSSVCCEPQEKGAEQGAGQGWSAAQEQHESAGDGAREENNTEIRRILSKRNSNIIGQYEGGKFTNNHL